MRKNEPDRSDDPDVRVRPATPADRRDVYRWMAESDITPFMMGPPVFPEIAIPAWDEFCADYKPHFFDGSRPDLGQSFIIEAAGVAVGHVSYSHDGLPQDGRTAELDIWMRSLSCCGKGYGPAALRVLMIDMQSRLDVRCCIVRPSLRNPRAIRVYEKAGFRPTTLSLDDQIRCYGPGEFHDTLTLQCSLPVRVQP